MNRTHHIAVIDDERESLAAISRALRRVGYQVDSYEDSQAAMAQLDRFKQFDLVITDLKMPRVTGMDLLRAVRSVNPEAGVLMVTGHGTVETAVEAMRLGADDYILKPLDLFELRGPGATDPGEPGAQRSRGGPGRPEPCRRRHPDFGRFSRHAGSSQADSHGRAHPLHRSAAG